MEKEGLDVKEGLGGQMGQEVAPGSDSATGSAGSAAARGRAAAFERYRAANPDAGDDVDDDTLYEHVLGERSAADERYNSLAGANSRLAELVARDPKLATALAMIAGDKPKSFPYAVARVYGKDFFSAEGDELEEFEKGYQEHLKELADNKAAIEAADRNIEEYRNTLAKFAQDNGLGEEEVETLHKAIHEDAINLLQGIIPVEFIGFKWKGLNYEKDVQAAADAGLAEGKNKVIEAKMRKATRTPVAGGSTTSVKLGPRRVSAKKKRSFFDGAKDVD
jgi:hypothetical protein